MRPKNDVHDGGGDAQRIRSENLPSRNFTENPLLLSYNSFFLKLLNDVWEINLLLLKVSRF